MSLLSSVDRVSLELGIEFLYRARLPTQSRGDAVAVQLEVSVINALEAPGSPSERFLAHKTEGALCQSAPWDICQTIGWCSRYRLLNQFTRIEGPIPVTPGLKQEALVSHLGLL